MKPLTRKQIAECIGVSNSHLCDIFNGKKAIGRKTAEKLATHMAGRQWFKIVDMAPEQIELEIRESFKRNKIAESQSGENTGTSAAAALARAWPWIPVRHKNNKWGPRCSRH